MPALPLLMIAALPMIGSVGCSSSKGSQGDAGRKYDTVTLMTGLRYIEFEKGNGKPITTGMTLSVDYAGYLTNGTLFDTSIDSVGANYDPQGRPFPSTATAEERRKRFDRGGYPFQPISFVVGKGDVIRGWDEGVLANMNVGGRRRLILPPELGYGAYGSGPIPANSTLIFDIHVVSAK